MIQFDIINILKSGLDSNTGISSAILYGSFARKEESLKSDIDLAVLTNEKFDVKLFSLHCKELLAGFDILHILHVELRNKIVVFFKKIPKLEIAILYDIKDIERNYRESKIPADFINSTILFDKTGTVKNIIKQISLENSKFDKIKIISDLIDKFVYEYESCSYYHSRSDAYKFYFFYNIALHIAVQLKYLADGNTDFYFLPKNFAAKNLSENVQREEFYALSCTTYLRDANTKKRKLLSFFYSAVQNINYPEFDNIKLVLENLYERDFLWNFRDIAKYNTYVKPGIIFRASSPTPFQKDEFLHKFMKINNIQNIIDLRSKRENTQNPYLDEFIVNFNYTNVPFDPWNQPEWFKAENFQGSNSEIAYRFFVKACKDEIKKVFESIHQTESATIIHCLAGKDRTGFIIMLINMLADTPYEIILNDYLASELDSQENKFKIFYDNVISEGGIMKYLIDCGLNINTLNEIKVKLKK